MSKIAYIDATDFHHELGECSSGTIIYSTLKSMLENNFCSIGCGVLKVEIHQIEQVVPSDLESISFTVEEIEEPSDRYAQRTKERIEHLKAKRRRLEAEIDSISRVLEALKI